MMLLHDGHCVALSGRRVDRLHETANISGAATSSVLVHPADLRSDQAAKALVDATLERFGRIDTLVNCAGVAPMIPLPETQEALLHDTFEVNAFGPAALIRRCWPTFLSQQMGCIVNISTLGTTDPFPGYFAYAAAKSALDSMTRSAAREGRRRGIRAFSVNLGIVETDMLRRNFSEAQIPKERAISAEQAAFIKEFIDGKHDDKQGQCIPMKSP